VATAVVLLGLLAGFVAEARSGAPVGAAGSTAPTASTASAFTSSGSAVTVTVTVDPDADPGSTVWDVARQVAPAASGPELAALAERIVVDNGLSSVRVSPGQQLRVTVG
jgi:hypothetical protein